jgi:DNA repair photolyase
MGVYGGLKPEDWTHWGQWTTLKVNAAERTLREMRPDRIVYCSPLVDPYQPAESVKPLMPDILRAVIAAPPRVFVIQTRGPLILRDLELLCRAAEVTILRISFSITTNRDEVRRRYEPHCESNQERLRVIRKLRASGLEVYATLAPLLPCDPEQLAVLALAAAERDLIGDPLHDRRSKPHGATTRASACLIAEHHGETEWFEPEFQESIVARIRAAAQTHGRQFVVGPKGFSKLTVC